MELKHIDIAKLAVSPANMRAKGKAPDIANILPSVRARGVLVPLIVRQNGTPDTYEIVAGKRRYHAALALAEEGGRIDELPCAVIEPGDDAAALEASLIENISRLDPDEVTRWETFTRLVREGRSPEDIALTFGLTEVQVKRTLALGNLLPRIRNLYRAEQIDAVTVRHLTLASKARQREWLALFDSENAYAPVGSQLKAWLFGGASISTQVALFDLASFDGAIVADLFGEDSYFADAAQFWTAQNAAIEEAFEDLAFLIERLATSTSSRRSASRTFPSRCHRQCRKPFIRLTRWRISAANSGPKRFHHTAPSRDTGQTRARTAGLRHYAATADVGHTASPPWG
jgi:ParB family transcriptional regulator, chromosome partitioning protein